MKKTNKKQKYELLAPVGNFSMLKAAIDAGTDAVYLGLKEFTMRATAQNFSLAELKKARKICNNQKHFEFQNTNLTKERKVKIYLTLNTIIYEKELKKVEKIISKISKQKLVDAIICWDFSIINPCKKYKMPFHISTQASVSNSITLQEFKKLGAERVVFARELDLKQIATIHKKFPKLEIECFAHGAMCVSISGRCFTSQFLYNKSANRGECLHPCRREYEITDTTSGKKLKLENNRVMSAKDLNTLPIIEKLKKAGITSYKIEGRNRSPEYVSAVVKVYRKALDKKLSKQELKNCLEELRKVYHRGFSSGFYLHTPTPKDFSTSENGEQTEKKQYIGKIEKFWPKAKAAALKIHAGKIKLNDEVYISSNTTGIKRFQIKSMEIEKKKVSQASKGELVGIQTPICRRGDEIYLIIKK